MQHRIPELHGGVGQASGSASLFVALSTAQAVKSLGY